LFALAIKTVAEWLLGIVFGSQCAFRKLANRVVNGLLEKLNIRVLCRTGVEH
jgi:hypothetical protein